MTKKIIPLNLLVEIGAEELPLSALDLIYSDFKTAFGKLLDRERISFSAIEVEATPRRIAFFVSNLSSKQKDLKLEISGPSVEKAYDAAGKPTLALLGFIKSKEISEKDIEVRDTPKGKFVFGHKELKGKTAAEVLPVIIQEVFQVMPFKRGLRWDATGYKFPRPIRWVVALLGNSVLKKFKIADVTSGKTSFGHRFLSPKAFTITKADWQVYSKLLEKQQVILSIEKREALIRDELEKKYGQKNSDEELVHECAQLVEKPFLIEGGFSKEYLELPGEVLATCMKKHQRIFAIYQNGKLQNRFVAVMNGKREGLKISANFEKVLDSRLKDARFFYQDDTKQTLESRREKLEQLAYLGSLGSMKDKVERLEKAAPHFCQILGDASSTPDLSKVCKLAKNDLLTHLVFEMPELQGIVGGEYARHAGEKEEVVDAISKQYLPKNLAEPYQSVKSQMNKLSALFGVLDRLDLLVGAFGTGIEPTGSQDPFALRRAGGILVKLIRAFNIHFRLDSICGKLEEFYYPKLTRQDSYVRLAKFLQDRVAFELSVKPGMPEYEILQAVIKTRFDDLADVFSRYEKMIDISQKDKSAWIASVKIVQRIANILKGSRVEGWNPSALVEEKEIALGGIFKAIKNSIESTLENGNLREANHVYARDLTQPITEFFEKVMVNAEDAEIRKNRLGLLTEIRDLYTQNIADLSLLSRIEE